MLNVTAPYRFVPLSNLIAYPSWADKVSHDKPFKDGINGELTIQLENQTPLCVGRKKIKGTKEQVGEVHFYHTPNGKPAIPATSLKNMLRNVLEIASFSRMKQVEDQKLGVRDLSQSDNFYMSKIKNSKSGWLKFDKLKGWVVYPCSYGRVHQNDIINLFGISYQEWTKKDENNHPVLGTVEQRYSEKRIGICPDIKYTFDKKRKTTNENVFKISKTRGKDGILVMTGQPGGFFYKNKINQPTSAKKYEFVFYNTQEKPLEVSSTVMSGFRQIHEGKAGQKTEWDFWQQNIDCLKHGIPVFYHANGTVIRSMGLAMMYKLPYKNSIHDAIAHSNKQHTSTSQNADMSDLLFGYLGDDEQQLSGLRGRVSVGFASLLDNTPLMQFSPPIVLMSPQPTYYPAYIYQDGKGRGFHQLMQPTAKIAGWKRYQAKSQEHYPPLDSEAMENKGVQVKLETIADHSKFEFKIRVHNLRPVELGALLWSLDFGGDGNGTNDYCHGLGRGKPLGLGLVKLKINDNKLVRNDGQDIADESLFLQGCRYEFQEYMNEVFVANGVNYTTWQACDTVKALQEYATPVDNFDDYQYLSDPKDFVDLKKYEYIDDFADDFHKYHPIDVANADDIQVAEYQLNITDNIAKAQAERDKLKQQQERNKAKVNASGEDKALYEIEDFIQKAETEITGTMKKNVHKILKEPYDNYSDTFDDEQRALLKDLANQISALFGSSKQLDKVIEKINAML